MRIGTHGGSFHFDEALGCFMIRLTNKFSAASSSAVYAIDSGVDQYDRDQPPRYVNAREVIDSSGEIMVLTTSCPWKPHIFELEEEMKIAPSVKYVIYQDDRSEKWRVQAVAVAFDKFESRKPLPSLWRGLTDEELSEAVGIPGCIFVHISGFIGGNHSYEGALAMARASLMS